MKSQDPQCGREELWTARCTEEHGSGSAKGIKFLHERQMMDNERLHGVFGICAVWIINRSVSTHRICTNTEGSTQVPGKWN